MARMVVIYRKPQDPQAFDQHYFGVHVPLAKKLAGLRRYEISHGPIVTRAGSPDTYLVAILHFDDMQAIQRAFASPEGEACAADVQSFVRREDMQMFLYDDRVV